MFLCTTALKDDLHLRLITLTCLVFLISPAWGSDIEPLERIQDTTLAFLTERFQGSETIETEITLGRLNTRLRLTRCADVPTAQLPPGTRPDGNITVNLRCAQPVAWSIFVPATITRFAEVVVATRPLARQQTIESGDVRLERKKISGLANGYFETVSEVVGLQARRAMALGQIFNSAHVAPRHLIQRGQEVTLRSELPGLSVRMVGEALEDGALGQRIRVRNRSSKKIVEGYVESSDTIRVPL